MALKNCTQINIKQNDYSLKLNGIETEEENTSSSNRVFIEIQKDQTVKHGTAPLNLKKELKTRLKRIPFYNTDKNIFIPEKIRFFQEKIVPSKIKKSDVIAAVKEFQKKNKHIINIQSGFSSGVTVKKIKNSFSFNLEKKEKKEGFYCYAAVRKNEVEQTSVSFIQKNALSVRDIKKCLNESYNEALALTSPEKIKSGVYKVLFFPKAFLELFSALVSNFNGESVYASKTYLNKKHLNNVLFSPLVSLIDDKKFSRDDEGFNKKKTYLVKNGRVLNFLTDYDYSVKLKVENTANAFKTVSGSFIAPAKIYIKPSKISFKETLRKMQNGIAVTKIQLGSGLNLKTGELSCQIDGRIIKNGVLKAAFSNCGLRGNLFNLMKNVIVASKEIEFYGNMGLPYIGVKNIKITGNK